MIKLALLFAVSVASMAAPAAAQVITTTADHNASLMKVEIFDGGHTVISYQTPRPGLAEAGVVPGTIVFSGQLVAGRIRGNAYAFKSGCEPLPYSVDGGIEGRTIFLAGPGPQRAPQGCRITGFSDKSPHARLNFTVDEAGAGRIWAFSDPTASRPRTGEEMRTITGQPPAPTQPRQVMPMPPGGSTVPPPPPSARVQPQPAMEQAQPVSPPPAAPAPAVAAERPVTPPSPTPTVSVPAPSASTAPAAPAPAARKLDTDL